MTKPLRILVLTAAVAVVALGGAARSFACGNSEGYSYNSVARSSDAHGISAELAPVGAFDISDGHVAGWVGVSGPNELLQVGYAGFPSVTGSDIYYEVELPGRYPTYHEVSTGNVAGTYTKVTVLEMQNRPGSWRVWVNHKPVSGPIRLPGSTDGLKAAATSESWDGGTSGICNDFHYSFRNVLIARAPGGDWQQFTYDPRLA